MHYQEDDTTAMTVAKMWETMEIRRLTHEQHRRVLAEILASPVEFVHDGEVCVRIPQDLWELAQLYVGTSAQTPTKGN